MLPATNKQTVLNEDVQLRTGASGAREKIRSQFSFDPEFSLPPYFFDKDFLDNANLCEPRVNEKVQPENDLLRQRTRSHQESQEYRC